MMFFKKKTEQKKESTPVFNKMAFMDGLKNNNYNEIGEPWTLAKERLENGAKDFNSEKGLEKYKEHKVKIQNQWINPLQSVNSGFGNAQDSFYIYQPVNYYECYSLAQDPLFNKIFNILSKTPFANGGEVVDELDDQEADILETAITEYKIQNLFVKALRSTYVCGGCLLYLDFGDDEDLEEPLDLKTMDMKKFRGFIHLDPLNLVAVEVNTSNPAQKDYMQPTKWYVVGLGTVHASRFLKFEDNVPELLMKPMTLYFGMPLTLLIKQDVSNSNLASQGLANLMNRCRYLYLKTEGENFVSDAAIAFRERLEAMSLVQDNFGVYPLKSTEDMFQLTTSVQGMDSNAEFFYQIVASKTDITLSILLGKGAQGLSGTLEGERKNFFDRIRAIQEMVKPNLLIALGIIYGKKTDGKFREFKDYIFNPLEESDEREKAENLRSYIEVAKAMVEMGVKNEDVLNWLKKYKDFNLENVEFDTETENLEDYGDEDLPPKEERIEDKDKVLNSDFRESDHPRDDDGKFTSKGGSSGSHKEEKAKEESKGHKVVHSGVMKKIESYRGKPAGTYDLATGKLKEYKDGYCVSFHQNEPDENGNYKSHMGRYSEKEYDDLTNQLQDEGLEVNMGVYDNEPEVSFWTNDKKKALKLMKKFNQESVYDVKKNRFIENPFYDKTKNPMQ